MFEFFKFIFLILVTSSFGFLSLSQILQLKSLIFLIPSSIIFGLTSFVFLTHILAYIFSPASSSIVSLALLLAGSLIIIFLKRNEIKNIDIDISRFQLLLTIATALIICILTYIAIFRYGTFDRTFHIPIAVTMFHNNTYPPRDPFRPDYVLLYHYGGDLLAGAVYNICNFDISTSYEVVSALLSGTTFLSFFLLGWLLSKNYKVAFLAGFCTYFGGGLLWLDAIIRFLTKNLPNEWLHWSFLETFLNLGVHGSITNPPSVLAFTSTFAFGNPILIFCLILFWKMTQENNIKKSALYIIFLIVSLFILYMTTDWLFVTFWAAVIPFLIFLWVKKYRKIIPPAIVLLLISGILVKTIGSTFFLQDPLQGLGRTNIFDMGIKDELFSVVRWGRITSSIMNYETVSCFSWDFISEFGLSFFLFPLAIYYVIKTKDFLAILLFLSIITTMPVPTVIDFRLNPVELVRLFSFGNNMIILLITCSLCTTMKSFMKNKVLLFAYILAFCLSPIGQLISADILTPYALMNKTFVEEAFDNIRKTNSIYQLSQYFDGLNKATLDLKNQLEINFKEEIKYLKSHAGNRDAAISFNFHVPPYAGVYSFIPAGQLIYWDQLYSRFNSIHQTAFNTLDPNLLNELNIKWIIINDMFKENLPNETKEILNKKEYVKLVHQRKVNGVTIEIYKTKNLTKAISSNKRKTAWILVNKNGQLAEIVNLQSSKLNLFPTSKMALLYLQQALSTNPELGKQLITAQPIILSNFESQLKEANLNIELEKRF